MSDAMKAALLEKAKREKARRMQAAQPSVATTPDGRATAPNTTADMAANIPEGMVYNPETGGYVDTALMAERGGKAQGAAASYLSGTPFIGEYVDEGMGQLDAAVSGRSPEIAQEYTRQARQQFKESNPKTAVASEIAGGIVGSIPLAAGAAGLIPKGAGILQKSAAGLALGAVGGGTEGAVSGYGSGRNNAERRKQAVERGAMGAALGGAIGAAAPVVASGAKSVLRRLKKTDVSAIAAEFGTDKKTAAAIRNHLINDDLDAAAKRIAALGDDAMLADAGKGTAQALDSAMASGGKALRIGREAAENRATASNKKLAAALDDILGESGGIKAAGRDIAKRTSTIRQKAYDAAYSKKINYAADAGRNVESVLDRIPRKTLRSAIDEANDAMRAAGVKNKQIMAEIAEDGGVKSREMPNVQQLDEIKKALGDIASREVDDMGRPTAAGLRASGLARDLRDAVAESVPEYRRALKLGGDKIAEDNALRLGRDMLSRRIKVEDAREIMEGASVEARAAAKRGLRESIEETLSNVRRTISDPNTDAREAMQIAKDMSSRANMSKLRLVLGPKDANRMLKELDQATAALELRAAVSANSQTAIRLAGQASINEQTSRSALGTLTEGRPVEAAQKAIQSLTGATDAASVRERERIFAEISRVLTSKRGADARRALVVARRAIKGQALKETEVETITKAVGVPTLSAIHQSGMQVLEK